MFSKGLPVYVNIKEQSCVTSKKNFSFLSALVV